MNELDHDPQPPYRVTGTRVVCKVGRLGLRSDTVAWADGTEDLYAVVEGPNSVYMVPVFEDGSTLLVRQWRHAFGGTSWEVCAGTLEPDEDPADGARRELIEETGYRAGELIRLEGSHRSLAAAAFSFRIFICRELEFVGRSPERYEADMVVRRLPFREALEHAVAGRLHHGGSVTALVRAAHHLGLI